MLRSCFVYYYYSRYLVQFGVQSVVLFLSFGSSQWYRLQYRTATMICHAVLRRRLLESVQVLLSAHCRHLIVAPMFRCLNQKLSFVAAQHTQLRNISRAERSTFLGYLKVSSIDLDLVTKSGEFKAGPSTPPIDGRITQAGSLALTLQSERKLPSLC